MDFPKQQIISRKWRKKGSVFFLEKVLSTADAVVGDFKVVASGLVFPAVTVSI